MSDYRSVLGDKAARDLGLGQSPTAPESLRERLERRKREVEDYKADPAEAFSRMAERLHADGAVAVPFSNLNVPPLMQRNETVLNKHQLPHSEKPRPASPEGA